jgi:glycosyltransferase involved in cell wall biosynthesis
VRIALWHNLPSGGGKRALYHHVRGLQERGHVIESWCPSGADQEYWPLHELIPEHILPFYWEANSHHSLAGRILKSYKDVVDKIHAMDLHCQQCAEQINQGNFDIVFANSCTFFRVSSIARYVNIPKILYLQEPYRWLYEAMPTLPWLAIPPPRRFWWSPRYLSYFFRDLIRLQGVRVQAREELANAQAFDQILVNSLFSRETILRTYGLEANVCYLGVDTELFKPLHLPRENFVVGLGTIYPGKGIDRAIRALGTIEEKKRPPLIWIGNGSHEWYQKEVGDLASALNVQLSFKIHISDHEVVTLLNQASLMLYTSRLEPFGFAPLEANACGTPVVAIAEGGIRETVQHGVNGLLVDADNPKILGDSILHLLENPNILSGMGQKAREHVIAHWTWDDAIDRLEHSLLAML